MVLLWTASQREHGLFNFEKNKCIGEIYVKKSKLTGALLVLVFRRLRFAITLPFLHSKSELRLKGKLGVFNKLKDSTDNATGAKIYPNIRSDNRLEIENAIKYTKNKLVVLN